MRIDIRLLPFRTCNYDLPDFSIPVFDFHRTRYRTNVCELLSKHSSNLHETWLLRDVFDAGLKVYYSVFADV